MGILLPCIRPMGVNPILCKALMGELSIPRHEWGLKGPSYCKCTMGNLFFLRGFNRKPMAKV